MTGSRSIGRWTLVTIGVLSFCSALVVLTTPSLEELIQWPWDDESLLVTFFTVSFVGACLLVPFVVLGETDRTTRTERPSESVPSTPVPGSDLERVLDRRLPRSRPLDRRLRVRTRFRRAVLRSIVRTDDCSTETARERLETGSWTDDPVAATFVRVESGSEPSRLRSVVDWLTFPRRARRAARAIRSRVADDGADR